MMNGDLISRSALIKHCEEIAACDWNKRAAPVSWSDAYEHFADEVEAAPAVDAGPKWNSVKDRMPERTVDMRVVSIIPCLVAIAPPKSQPKRKPTITKAQRQWNPIRVRWEWSRGLKVTHWMPLPEPPKEG